MTDRTIEDLATLVLEAGRDPSLWGRLLPAIGASFPGLKSSIHLGSTRNASYTIAYADGHDAAAVERYAAHFGTINPWNDFWAKAPSFRAFASDEALPAARFEATEFYNDWLAAAGVSATGMKLAVGADDFGAVSLHYGSGLAERYNRELPRILAGIAGPLRNALQLNRRLLAAAPLPAPLDVLIEAFDEPTFLLDATGRVKFENAAATRLLGSGGLVREGGDGRLSLSDRSADHLLGESLAAIRLFDLTAGASVPAAFAVRSGSGDVVAFAKVLAVPAAGTTSSPMAALFQPSRFALVTIYPRDRRQSPPDMLRSLFGLTPAEARVAVRLQRGETPSEVADALGLSRETIRRQLKAVFAKTNTRRQAELALLLARLP